MYSPTPALHDLIEAATADRHNGVPAIVALALDSNGKYLINEAAGYNAIGSLAGDPITSHSVFRLSSITKIVTSIAALRLVSRGDLALDDAGIIKKHLPELCALPIISYPSPESDAPFTLSKREKKITLRKLLTHTSGATYDILHPLLQRWRAERGETPCALTASIMDAITTPLVFEPGEGWAYGAGLDWVGLLIERVTGKRLGVVFGEEIFTPLGISKDEIGFHPAELGEGGLVKTGLRTPQGALVEFPGAAANLNAERDERGGGALLASPDAMMMILGDLVREEGSKLLGRDMLDLLFDVQLEEGGKDLEALRDATTLLEPILGPLGIKKDAVNHSLGGLWMGGQTIDSGDSDDLGGFDISGTVAWDGGFNLRWLANRRLGVAAFFASSVVPPNDAKVREVLDEFVREVFRKVQEIGDKGGGK